MPAEDQPLGASFAADVRRDGDAVVAVLRGELDVETAEDLLGGLGDVPAGGRCALDLRELVFMDSSGVRALLRIGRRATEEGWTPLLVVRRGGMVDRLLELCRPGDHLEIVHDAPGWVDAA